METDSDNVESESNNTWSDTSEEDESQNSPPLQSRAYQIEMFEHSMKGNIIAVMGTGSGKTLIAKLRIEAELDRSPDRLVWFTAPSVVLAYQQYRFLSQQLPAYQFKLITGMDNAEYWTSLDIWQKVLHNINVVVSTPSILEQALDHAFVSMMDISLLVFDEAHHCVKKSSMNKLMQNHYHSRNLLGSNHDLPHILGLSASPITKKSTKEVAELEKNLNATCKSPFQQLEAYSTFVNVPEPLTLTYTAAPHSSSDLLSNLNAVVSEVKIEDDPATAVWRQSKSPHAQEKLAKTLKKQCTPAMEEMRSLTRTCTDLQENLGLWACDMFIRRCVEKVELSAFRAHEFFTAWNPSMEKSTFMAARLQSLNVLLQEAIPGLDKTENVSSKVKTLIEFLGRAFRPDLRCLVFVKTRPTAWSLTDVINNHPHTQSQYRAFSFVGVSNPTHKGAFDFAELRDQHENLEAFRRGDFNICVATSVLEEGVDVPAMNLVICFDARPNFRSFIQSRGRARQQESQFVMFPDPHAATKTKHWQTLEDEMKKECEKSLELIRNQEEVDEVNGTETEVFRVDSTGAVLTYASARPHLDRFCARMPDKDRREQTGPIFLLEGEHSSELRARVYLPSSLPPALRTAASRYSWRTEKRAKQDAAFQAYRALYEAGLVSDHLLPPEWQRENKAAKEDEKIEQRDSFYSVDDQYDPWPAIMELWHAPSGATVFSHRLTVEASDGIYPKMLILLPIRLSPLAFPLFPNYSARLQVTVEAGVEAREFPTPIAQDTTFLLLTTLLGRRLQNLNKDQMPLLIVPDIEPSSLQAWYEAASTSMPVTAFNKSHIPDRKTYLVRYGSENIPRLWQPTRSQSNGANVYETAVRSQPSLINATRLPRQLNYLMSYGLSLSDQSKSLSVDECSLLGIPSEYARVLLLIPSIMFELEISLRTAAACQGPLSTVGLHSQGTISQAMTLPVASVRNYERLEFYGDTLLKFYASLQLFVDHPNHPSYQLTRNRRLIINNSRLQRATTALKLGQYLTRRTFAGNEWAVGAGDLGMRTKKQPAPVLSSKTLADIVEAMIGAASLSEISGGYSEDKLLTTLSLFIDEIPWRSASENVMRICHPDQTSQRAPESLAPVERMIGYVFEHRELLAEALTHSSLAVDGRSTYDRLEFLGDAVLDYIIGPKLFHSPLNLPPAEMTYRRAALASHHLLAFFALSASSTRKTFHVHTDVHTTKTTNEQGYETIHLPDYIRTISNREASEHREAVVSTFQRVRPKILKELEHGARFPWTLLSGIGAPKLYSDIIESTLAAVFIDSKGNLQACESVLEEIGYMSLVRRFISEKGVDTTHPESMLLETIAALGGSSTQSSLETIVEERNKSTAHSQHWRCKIMLEGQLIASVSRAATKERARLKAAEKAVDVLRKMRKLEPIKNYQHKVTKRQKQEQEEEDGYEEEDVPAPSSATEALKDSAALNDSPKGAKKSHRQKSGTRVAWLSDDPMDHDDIPENAVESQKSETRVAWLSDEPMDDVERISDPYQGNVVDKVEESPRSKTRYAWFS